VLATGWALFSTLVLVFGTLAGRVALDAAGAVMSGVYLVALLVAVGVPVWAALAPRRELLALCYVQLFMRCAWVLPLSFAMGCAPEPPPRTVPKAQADLSVAPSARSAPSAPAHKRPPTVVPASVAEILVERGLQLELAAGHRIETPDGRSRFAFVAEPEDGAYRLGYALGAAVEDTSSAEPMVARTAYVFTHNFARDDAEVCSPQPELATVTASLGADEAYRLCFPPARWLGDTYRFGVSYAIFKKNVGLILLILLTNDPDAMHGGPERFGLSFAPTPANAPPRP
jgi:hypothetical protein